MVHSFTSSGRIARLRAPVFTALILALVGCDSTESLDPTSSLTPDAGVEVLSADAPELAAVNFAGGIPFGMAAPPLTAFDQRFNGGKLTVSPGGFLNELAVVRARGGRVVIVLAGSPRYYLQGGRFSLTEWKARVARFKGINFASYINDGTIVAHYLIDEPNDPRNWGGRPVPASVIEEMAQYSKELWPGLATVARVQPDYLDNNHRYLDAAWAQYLSRRGNVDDYIRENVAEAQKRGLGLIVGLNVLKGGNPNGSYMSANEVEAYGSALLSSSYPCAFIMWQYNSSFLRTNGMGSAMDALRRKAESRSTRSCRG